MCPIIQSAPKLFGNVRDRWDQTILYLNLIGNTLSLVVQSAWAVLSRMNPVILYLISHGVKGFLNSWLLEQLLWQPIARFGLSGWFLSQLAVPPICYPGTPRISGMMKKPAKDTVVFGLVGWVKRCCDYESQLNGRLEKVGEQKNSHTPVHNGLPLNTAYRKLNQCS